MDATGFKTANEHVAELRVVVTDQEPGCRFHAKASLI
jgi:hypothetical protein